MILFSGCFGGGGDGTSATSEPTTTHPGTSTAAGNSPPDVSLSVLVNGVPQPGTEDVEAAPDDNVTLDASASSDPDGDSLTFSWTVDGSPKDETGPTLDVALTAGNHTATVTVSDGVEDALANASIRILAGAGGSIAPTDDPVIVKTFEGTFNQKFGVADDNVPRSPYNFTVPPGAKQITAWVTWTDAALIHWPMEGDLDIYLKNPKGTEVAKAETSDFEYLKVTDPKSLVPGNWSLELFPYTAAKMSWDATVLVYMVKPTLKNFTGTTTGGVLADGETDYVTNNLTIGTNATFLSGRLTWTTAVSSGACSRTNRVAVDYDLYLYANTTKVTDSAAAAACEFLYTDAKAGAFLKKGEYDFRVAPFIVGSATWKLTVEIVTV